MKTEFSFRDACNLAKSGKREPALIEKADALLGCVIILSPLAISVLPVYASVIPAALALLSSKNELTKAGKLLFEKVTKKQRADDYVSRIEAMGAAHTSIIFNAFFDAVKEHLQVLKVALKLPEDAAFALAQPLLPQSKTTRASAECPRERPPKTLEDSPLPLPHPTHGFEFHRERLTLLYKDLHKGLVSLLPFFEGWEALAQSEREAFVKGLEAIPAASFQRYEAQYYELAARYNDFFVWAALSGGAQSERQLTKLSSEVKELFRLLSPRRGTDVGLRRLEEAIDRLPHAIERKKTDPVILELQNGYREAVRKPIVTDKPAASDGPSLAYPKRHEIFIPQSFRVLCPTSTDKLEDEGTWEVLSIFVDGDFQAALVFLTPSAKVTPAITSFKSADPFNARQLFDALSISL